jgi:hypothetical protein
MAEDGKRPFWMHQLVEYILGAALVATGLQTPMPLVPAVLGGIIMGHAAITSGALAAFRVIDRRLHRVIDPAIIGLTVVGAVQPWIEVDPGTRLIIAGIAVVHAIVWLSSSFTEKPKKVPKSKQPKQPVAAEPATPGEPSAAAPAAKPASAAAAPEPAPEGRSADLGRSAGRMAASGVNAVRRVKDKRTNK